MFYLVLGFYTLALIAIWGFFFVAKIHAYKFRNFSPHILKVTFGLSISLIVMSLLGYILIFNIKGKLENFSLGNTDLRSNPIIEEDNDFGNNDEKGDFIDYNSY